MKIGIGLSLNRARRSSGGAAWWTSGALVDLDYQNDRAYVNGTAYASLAAARTAGVVVQSGGIDRVPVTLGTNYTLAGKGVTASTSVSTARYLVTVDDGADGTPLDEAVYIYQGLVSAQQVIQAQVWVGSLIQAGGSLELSTTIGNSAAMRAAVRVNANNFAFSCNGGTVQTDTAGTIPTVTQMVVGNRDDGTRPWEGTLQRVLLINQNVDNATLQGLLA